MYLYKNFDIYIYSCLYQLLVSTCVIYIFHIVSYLRFQQLSFFWKKTTFINLHFWNWISIYILVASFFGEVNQIKYQENTTKLHMTCTSSHRQTSSYNVVPQATDKLHHIMLYLKPQKTSSYNVVYLKPQTNFII